MKWLRQRTIEPVLRSLVDHYGLIEIAVLGKAGADKLILMSATCFNLKKYLRTFNRKLVQSAAKEVIGSHNATFSTTFDRFELISGNYILKNWLNRNLRYLYNSHGRICVHFPVSIFNLITHFQQFNLDRDYTSTRTLFDICPVSGSDATIPVSFRQSVDDERHTSKSSSPRQPIRKSKGCLIPVSTGLY